MVYNFFYYYTKVKKMNPKSKKTIGFLVRNDYTHKGTEVKKAIDVVLTAMYNMLTREQKNEIKAQFKKEMEMLKW